MGSNVADFWTHTSYMPILPDLLLAEILETWGLSESSLKKSVKKKNFSSEIGSKSYFSILDDQNRLVGGWGGAGRLFGLP